MKKAVQISILIFMMLFFTTASAQEEDKEKQKKTRIEIIDGDLMQKIEELGPDVMRISGNVVFKHDSMYLYCDTAFWYNSTNSLKAWGNVHIKASDSLNIFGEELFYHGDKHKAEMRDEVKLVDNQMILTTDYLDYDLAENIGKYTGGGKIVDTTNQLTSQIGYYYADEKNFFFKDSVNLVNPRYTMDSDTLMYNTLTEISYFFGPSYIRSDTNLIYCENGWYDTRSDLAQFNENAMLTNNRHSLQGDSLFYDRNLGLGKAFRNVTVIDSVQNIVILGEYGRFLESTHNSVITDSAQAIQIDNGDSLFLHADTLRYLGDTAREEGKQLFAYYKVKLYRVNLQGKCDSLVYNVEDSLIKMYRNPVIWSGKNQLYADFVKFFTGKGQSKKVHLLGNSYLSEMDADSSNFNQVKGKNMYGFFRNDELYKVDVEGNAQTVYFLRNDENELVGVHSAQSSDIVIRIHQRKISNISYKTQPSGKLYPPAKLPSSEATIKGFRWQDHTRPRDRYDIFRWEE